MNLVNGRLGRFRELGASEIALISGGFGFNEDDGPIIVNGVRSDPWVTSIYLDDLLGVGMDFGDLFDGPQFNPLDDHGDGGGQEHQCPQERESDGGSDDGEGSQYPERFDKELDREVDNIAADLAKQFLSEPNPTVNESVALIWRDSDGNLHTTGVHEGTPHSAPIDQAWPEVDFANGGQVIGIIHSHPSHYDNGSGIVPVVDNNHRLSNGDFDTLLNAADGTNGGFDQDNVRSYIAQGGEVKEYYAFDQDASQKGQDSSVVVESKESSDYEANTSQEGQRSCPSHS